MGRCWVTMPSKKKDAFNSNVVFARPKNNTREFMIARESGVASGWQPGSRVPHVIAVFQMMDVVGRFAPQLSVTCLEIPNEFHQDNDS